MMDKIKKDDSAARRSYACVFLVGLGLVLILASWLPLGRSVSQAMWTVDDSADYDRVTQEYKRSAYQSSARSGLSEKDREAQRKRMKHQMETMQAKLEYAKQQPQRWSQYLLWSGVLLTGGGFLGHRLLASLTEK